MANTFKFGNGNWAVKDGSALAYNDENNNFKPLPFDFTRASSATRVNKQGLIETVPSGKPRIDFLNNTSGHLLLEPSRTNIVFYSEQLNNSVWNKLTNTTVTANQIVSPDGSQNADEFSATSTSTSLMAVQDGFSVFSSVDYVISFFAKKGSVRYVQLFNGGGQVTGNPRTNFDLQDGNVAIQDGDHTSSIEDFGNGWYRCTTKVTTLSTTLQMYINGVSTSTASRSSSSSWTSGDNFYVWGAMVEQGSYATSYIPTEGSSVTRVAERNSQGNLSNILSSSGVLYTEIELGKSTTNTSSNNLRFSLSNNGSTSDWVFFGIEGGDNLRTYVRASGSTTTDNTVNGVFPSAGTYKIAFRFDSNNTKVFVNGVEKYSDTSSTPPSNLNFIQQGGGGALASDIEETLKVIETRLYNTALSDSELQALTT